MGASRRTEHGGGRRRFERAARDGTTLKALVELGLRQVLAAHGRDATFRLRKASFRGDGLQPAAKNLFWKQLRELAYAERGR